ncbi:MAG TPA: hypothetical protein VLA79_19840, partial [Polyangia bacterium]|nr:hypothetical protein [Polyangia bacterium]
RTRGRFLSFSLGLALFALFAPSEARAQIHCRAPEGAQAALAATDARLRLEWIDQRLSHEAHRMSRWNYGWAIGIGATGVGSLIAVPFVDPDDRVDYYTGAALAAAGVLPFLLAPPDVIHDGRELHAMLVASPPGTDDEVCAMLADAERRLVDDARNEHLLSGWWAHAANVAINTGAFLFLGLGYHHWLSATITGASGIVIGEAVLFTQPTGTIDALARFQRGDLGP